MSMGSNYKTVGDNLLIQMYKQLRMSNVSELKRYIDSKYSYDNYLQYIKEKK
jgi:hypothetical protein